MSQIRGTANYHLGGADQRMFGGPSHSAASSDPSPLDAIREQTSKIEDLLDTYADPIKPWVLSTSPAFFFFYFFFPSFSFFVFFFLFVALGIICKEYWEGLGVYTLELWNWEYSGDHEMLTCSAHWNRYLPAIGRFLIVVTFLEDSLRIVSQWTDQLMYLHDYRKSRLLFPIPGTTPELFVSSHWLFQFHLDSHISSCSLTS